MQLAINFLFLSWRSCPSKFHSLIYFLNGGFLSHLLNGALMHWKSKRIFLNLPLVNFIILLWRVLIVWLRVECLSATRHDRILILITLTLLSLKRLICFVLFKYFRTVVTNKSIIILGVALIWVFLIRKIWFFVISLLALALVAATRLKQRHVAVLGLLQKVVVFLWLLTLMNRFFYKRTSLFVCWNCESFWWRTRRFLRRATIFARRCQIFLIEFVNTLETPEVVERVNIEDALWAEHSHRASWFAFFLSLFHICLVLRKQQIGEVNHVSSYWRRRFLAKCVCIGLRTDIFEVALHFFGLHWMAPWFIFSVRNDPLVATLFCHRRRTLKLVIQAGWLGSFRSFSARFAPFKRLGSATAIGQHAHTRFVRVGTASRHIAHLCCHVLFPTYEWLLILFRLNAIFVRGFKLS